MDGGNEAVPLTSLQAAILTALAGNRAEESYLAGEAGIHLASASPRRSVDIDLFHDRERAVAEAFARDRETLRAGGFDLVIEFSQVGFIRGVVSRAGGESVRIDWAHDSAWRFLPTVKLEGVGYVLHPVDLSVNKVLALAGRDEPRDLVDILYLHRKVLPLGALCWAACGKDPGWNPLMLIEQLARRGGHGREAFNRLDLAFEFDPGREIPLYRSALEGGREWIAARPADQAGCLYRRPETGLFFAPAPGEEAIPHRGVEGGVLPRFADNRSLFDSGEERSRLESFFERKVEP